MMDKLPDFLKFFVTLSNNAKLNVILLLACFSIGYWSYETQGNLAKQRDDFKDRYDKLYDKYTSSLDKNQKMQNELQANCNERFKTYRERKDVEVDKLVADYLVKYNELLRTYQELLKNKN
jgi:TPP-dependent pyruvate/acetoin dehydrogenase alpha subunit